MKALPVLAVLLFLVSSAYSTECELGTSVPLGTCRNFRELAQILNRSYPGLSNPDCVRDAFEGRSFKKLNQVGYVIAGVTFTPTEVDGVRHLQISSEWVHAINGADLVPGALFCSLK